MKEELTHQVASMLDRGEIEIGLNLEAGLRGISQSTWRKISERMEPSVQGKGLFHLRVARLELTLSDGCLLSTAEVRQCLRLSGGFVPLYLYEPES